MCFPDGRILLQVLLRCSSWSQGGFGFWSTLFVNITELVSFNHGKLGMHTAIYVDVLAIYFF